MANERPELVKASVNVEDPNQIATRDVQPESGPAYKLQAEPSR